ncbi:MAG: helix-turn-helix domain-containing protein [Verrucomicrobiota bacterium]
MKRAHRHMEIELFTSVDSKFVRRFGDEIEYFEKDELVIFWGCIPHQLLEMKECERGFIAYFPLSLFFNWNLPASFRQAILQGRTLRFSKRSSAIQLALDNLKNVLPKPNAMNLKISRSAYLLVQGSVQAIAEEYMKQNLEYNFTPSENMCFEKVVGMLEYLAANYQRPITANDICSSVNLNVTYGRTLFRKAVSMTLQKFLRQLRVEQAKYLLSQTDLPIIEVCMDSGFASNSRFYASFQETTHLSPKAYRQAAQKRIALLPNA